MRYKSGEQVLFAIRQKLSMTFLRMRFVQQLIFSKKEALQITDAVGIALANDERLFLFFILNTSPRRP